MTTSSQAADRKFFIGLARAFGGAIIFSLPLLMTMEMWWLGFYMNRLRLISLLLVMIPLLIAIDYYSGFRETDNWHEDVVDGVVALGIGVVASIVVLSLFGVLRPGMPAGEVVGKVALQAVAGAFGAVLANSQLAGGADAEEQRRERQRITRGGYGAELLFMATGAMFLAFNVAPTEEMVLIAYKITPLHALLILLASLVAIHGFVYGARFRGAPERHPDERGVRLFLHYSVVGYAIALAVSAYVLWIFGRFDSGATAASVLSVVVLGFPASIGAAAARLIL